MARMRMGIRSIDRWRSILAVAATLALALGTVQAAPAAADAAPVTQTFTCTGSERAFLVPDGVTSLRVVAVGAPGATLSVGPNTGGRGAQVTADVGVTPGQLLQVNVGCPGSGAAGGFNGGGTANSALYGGAGAGGGGASDIRTISRFGTGSLASRLIVAGGGGGEGGTNEYGNSTSGGAGGNAGADGGNAGGTTNSRGRAGTLTAGGAGGSATGTLGDPQPGSPGQAGTGGNGGAYGVNTPGRGGGGGGGGLYGGGGGGGGGILNSTAYGGGGGGGGSSLVPPGGTLTVAPAGTAPSVTITYVPPPPECADGLDNDGDGLIDFPADPGCTDADDDRELDPTGNDDFQDAEVLTGSSASATGSNVDASLQTGEPDHRNGNGSHSIWYRWTAPGSGSTTIELCGSDFDTVLAVYTGSAVNALTEVASNDDSGDPDCSTLNSRVIFDATLGVTYHIAVDGYGDNTGNVVLTLAGPADTVAPTVTVEQAAGQADPTSDSPITFTAAFSEPVTGFEASDVDLSASTAGGTLSATVTDAGDQAAYTVQVSGMSSSGDVVASVPAGAASDGAGNLSEASTSTDNRVAYDEPPPPAPATLSVVVSGHGAVHSMPRGIRCGTDCAEDYQVGTEVTLTARPGRDRTFAGWGGACAFAGAASTCTLTLHADTEVSAHFEP